MAEAKHISASDFLKRREQDGTSIILDVRDSAKFAEAHIDGAVNVQKLAIESEVAELIPQENAEIYCHCGGGTSGLRAAQTLTDLGYKNVHVIDGGWRSLKALLEKE